jgi:glucose-6-phosphate isomerase
MQWKNWIYREAFTDIVNIGIGGSDLGPLWLLKHCSFIKIMNVHFVSNIDGDHVNEVIKKLNPETTFCCCF